MLEKNFDPKSFEQNFSFEIEASLRKPKAEPFMVLLPPPNVTGSLHIGHSLCYTLQDILARYKRLRGYDVLFQPGLDHAGIATQLLVEKRLYDSGVEKKSLSREQLLKEIWLWKENSGDVVVNQMKILGISCDFSRQRFTMDEGAKKAVAKMFVRLFKDGFIYRQKKMVNWDPFIGTAISDLEVVEREVDGRLWYVKYVLANSDECITVATTRPETIFGDVAVAVNPDDCRYAHLIGKKVVVPLTDRKIPIIEDKYADMAKGSGAVKITPAHDFNDFLVGERHKLDVIEVIDARGELNENVPEIFQKMDRFAAREKVVELLDKMKLLVRAEDIKQTIPFGDRSGVALEPRITYQWFVDAEKLSIPAISAVKDGKIRFIPKHWENLYFEWLSKIRPWCVSRQIWWGHRVPAWYGPDGQVFVEESYEEAMGKAVEFYGKNTIELTQDADVLDTWFSSGMWPFITLGWPDKTDDMKRYYSKTTIVTGFDIIFFWIARMIMMGLHATGNIPFRDIYIHGLVRDEKGQKMSKYKGNVLDPVDLCNKYGADAVRYTLASMSSPGRNIKMNDRAVENGRNFLTKLWNAVRFSQLHGCTSNKRFDPNAVNSPLAKWIIYHAKNAITDVEQALESYRFDEAARHIYRCVWNCLCDWYMEFIKPILQTSHINPNEENSATDDAADAVGENNKLRDYDINILLAKNDLRNTAAWVILQLVRVLYPFCPFISKKLMGEIGVVDTEWPDLSGVNISFDQDVKEIELLKNVITSIRSMKQCLRISVGEKLPVSMEMTNADAGKFLADYGDILYRMAGVVAEERLMQSISIVVDGAVIRIGLGEGVDLLQEKKRLCNEKLKLTETHDEILLRLDNSEFLEKASENVIIEHKERLESIRDRIQKIDYVIQSLEIVE
ncbi:MAG: valine--tRNA ligase [Holosporaceae bacterium]|jgi:valyl-tRNA synthetase|nr:valine--tRNA ligase [Holosporaceae bacterium]